MMRNPSKRSWCLFVALFALQTGLPASPMRQEDGPSRVDLNAQPLYARSGFDAALIAVRPAEADAAWKRLPPGDHRGRIARLPELGLPDLPRRSFLDLQRVPEREFTYVVPFTLPEKIPYTVPGLHLAALGDNWEIFLNGTRVQAALFPAADGTILRHQSRRDVFFPFDPGLLRPGENILAFRIIGDPAYKPTGLFQASPNILDEYESIRNLNSEIWPVALQVIYLFMGVYHLFIYLSRRTDRYNLFYGLFSVNLGLYLFARTHTVYSLIADTALITRLEFGSLFFVLPCIGAFFEILSLNRVLLITKIYALFSAVLVLLQALLPLPFGHDLLWIWQLSALAMILYYFGYDLLWHFLSSAYRRYRRYLPTAQRRSLGSELLRTLRDTPTGNLVLGAMVLFMTAVFDILDAMFLHLDIVTSQYGFFVFTMGTALVLVNRTGFLHQQLSLSNVNLERRIDDLHTAKARVERNERKYRSLFDGTSEPVALLDNKLRFKECNAAAVDLFHLEGIQLEYTDDRTPTLPQRLYEDQRERLSTAERIVQAGIEMRTAKKPAGIPVRIRTAVGEIKSCTLWMEFIRSADEPEYLVRVAVDDDDALAKAFVEGRERFDIENTLSAADEVCRRACAFLPRYLAGEDANFIMMCLREMVLNAVEHGNLEITFKEKTEAQRNRNYFEFLQQRAADPRFKARRVSVEYMINAEKALFRVSDQGPGFDHQKQLAQAAKPGPELLEHGRGLLMTLAAFDRVQYNDKGNQVTLEKRFQTAAAPVRPT